jgi:hypothetical protein
MICPNCQIQCVWYDFGKSRVLQVIPSLAPTIFRSFIEWSQSELDELEFIELMLSFEELGNAIDKIPISE